MTIESSATRLLDAARRYDRTGALKEAVAGYEAAIAEAERLGDSWSLAEGLRRLAVVMHRMHEGDAARRLAMRSCDVARRAGDRSLLAEGLNTLGGFHLVEECFSQAEGKFREALEHAPHGSQLQGRIEQNLGTIRSTQGDHDAATVHYERSLLAFTVTGDEHSAAIAHHNLGVVSQERRRWIEAESHFRLALAAADRTGDTYLKGMVLLNRSEVLVAVGRLIEARRLAEFAASVFDELRASAELGDAYRVLGVVERETGYLRRAQARLRLAVELSATAGSALGEAEALRDLAITNALAGEGHGATELLVRASRALGRLRPCFQPGAVLEGNYPAAVRAWGQLLSVTDPPAAERAERMAVEAAAVARELGRDAAGQARIRLAAYLNGVSPQLIAAAELPWGLERVRDEVVERQTIGIVERYHCAAMGLSESEALALMETERAAWHGEVYAAFLRSRAA